MALGPKLEIKPSQSLLMTPQLRQAISLLQLSNLELDQLISEEISRNPLLEREDDALNDLPQEPPAAIDLFNQEKQNPDPDLSEQQPDMDYDNQFDDYGSDRESYEPDSSRLDYPVSTGPADENFDFIEQRLSATVSLAEKLEQQIHLHFAAPRSRSLARLLCRWLDPAGYFRGDLAQIASSLGASVSELSKILTIMQQFEPAGIFAVSLAQCLEIQLRDRNRYDPAIACLLQHLDLLADRNFKQLKKLCHADDQDLAEMIADIKSLNPKPAAEYVEELAAPVIPDVLVSRLRDGSYRVELNQASLPRVLINRSYYSEIKELAGADRGARRYLKENLRHAGFIIRALHQRAVTVLRVTEAIVKHQRDFFEYGIDHLKPLKLNELAHELEIHESTVSRVTNRKYLHSPRGMFELKFFLSAAAGSFRGDDNTSTTVIKHQIRRLIDSETPDNILSDDQLVELLARQGIKIARRTVAKYRESLKIPTSAQRKRQKRATK